MFTILKLHTISSTNTYLKNWAKTGQAKNGTVVVANNQYSGRGQRDANWQSEASKNLTFSLLYRFKNLKLKDQFYLNCATSLAIYEVLSTIIKDDLSIKWPNDIMSANKKLGGILIENAVKNGFIKQSVIGVGININQVNFPINLPQATSLSLISQKEFGLDIILKNTLNNLSDKIKMIENNDYTDLYNSYHQNLYKINIWSKFSDEKQNVFNGKIKGVNLDGTLSVLLENDDLKFFTNKTIRFL